MRPRVAVLVDLPREKTAGGHVKYWENIARAAADDASVAVDLTVYFSGRGEDEALSPHVRFRFLPPVFSSARLPFLPYTPAHTDLAPFHRALAKELPFYDVIHTTDAYFAFAKTAEKMAARQNIPLVTSFHTDTPAYAEVFTRETLAALLGKKIGGAADRALSLSLRERKSKEARLEKHLRACAAILALRDEDKALGERIGKTVDLLRLGVDRSVFRPDNEARRKIAQDYGLPSDVFWALFVGRVDVGKNMPLLLEACVRAVDQGANLHLLVAGLGPCCAEVASRLGPRATLAGHVLPETLATFYAASDVLCMASDIEIGGLIGAEALSCGCPLLVSQSSGVAALYGESLAIGAVPSDAGSWADALVLWSKDREANARRHEEAFRLGQRHVADWRAVFKETFLPVWRRVAKKENR
ncbi:MAG: glycosyltransferase [Alphaproteobacteria bacterium]|nr:glycosyltransferase [Alphaproteobacteria bacterium]